MEEAVWLRTSETRKETRYRNNLITGLGAAELASRLIARHQQRVSKSQLRLTNTHFSAEY